MLNTNLELRNSNEGVDYILKNIERLKEYKSYIYGVHLNLSLSGEYVKKSIESNKKKKLGLKEVLNKVYSHVEKIDYHHPFENNQIKEIFKIIPLKYLVYEFIGRSEKSIKEAFEKQNKILEI